VLFKLTELLLPPTFPTLAERSARRACKQPRAVQVRLWVGRQSQRRSDRLPDSCYIIQTVQELLGHKDVSMTMIYTHVLQRGGRGVHSSLDPH